LGVLIFQITWHLSSVYHNEFWAQLWPVNFSLLTQSNVWFDALVQVILSTQIATGALPIIIGKLVQKGNTSLIFFA
jgi:solute carrier family 6 (neurotransmitter transporter)